MSRARLGARQGDLTDFSWQVDAACRTADPELFFAAEDLGHEPPARAAERMRAAREVCVACQVSRACLSYALRHREPVGIWGGRTADERRALLAGQSLAVAVGS